MNKTETNLAEWVTELARSGNGIRLPTIRTLAARFGVSVERASKVLHGLAEEGLLEISRKKGITTPQMPHARKPESRKVPAEATERLYRVFISEIQEGILASGSALPKIAVAAREHRTSRATVCRTYERLRQEGLVHRRGRQNIVGNDGPRHVVGTETRERCVIVVQRHPNAFRDMMVHRWTRDFAMSFIREMSLIGGRAIPVSADMMKDASARGLDGRSGIANLVTELGDRCIGFLVAGQAWFYSTESFVELHELISRLCTFNRPVVWFDSMDAAGHYRNEKGTREKIHGILHKPHVRKRFARCHFDECGALRLVARALTQAGYNALRIPQLSVPTPHNWSWVDQRCDLLKSVIEKEASSLKLEIETPKVNPRDTIGSVLRRLDGSQEEIRERYLRKYHEAVHVQFHQLPQEHRYILELSLLAEFVKPPAGTCVLALNDHMAHAYCRRWELLGGSPSDIRHLVSFDDCLDILFPYQVSSVNFGFDLLGYKAFHFLLDDIPIDVGRYRSIGAVPRLSHRHTIRPSRC